MSIAANGHPPCTACLYFEATPSSWRSYGNCRHSRSRDLFTQEPLQVLDMRIESFGERGKLCGEEGRLFELKPVTWWDRFADRPNYRYSQFAASLQPSKEK